MRTTITLDNDVAAKLQTLMHERNLTFKDAVNMTLRVGLSAARQRTRGFRVQASPLGLRPGVSVEKALQLAGDLEDEELIRKMRLRK